MVTIDGTDASGIPLGITIDAGDGADSTFNTGDGFSVFAILVLPGTGQIEINGLTLTGSDTFGAGAIVSSHADLTVKNTIPGNASGTGAGSGIYAHFALAV